LLKSGDNECAELDPNGDGRIVAPWQEYENYDPESDSISDWGVDQSDEWRRERASIVWNWMCNTGGWWGSGCPEAYELAVWLLWLEGGALVNDSAWLDSWEGVRAMVTYYYYLFEDGITPEELAMFTAFFNPSPTADSQGNQGVFDAADWNLLMTRPADIFFSTTLAYWGQPPPLYGDGNMVTKWWVEPEDFAYNVAFEVLLTDGRTMYFGYP
jgi:hypothetical protein